MSQHESTNFKINSSNDFPSLGNPNPRDPSPNSSCAPTNEKKRKPSVSTGESPDGKIPKTSASSKIDQLYESQLSKFNDLKDHCTLKYTSSLTKSPPNKRDAATREAATMNLLMTFITSTMDTLLEFKTTINQLVSENLDLANNVNSQSANLSDLSSEIVSCNTQLSSYAKKTETLQIKDSTNKTFLALQNNDTTVKIAEFPIPPNCASSDIAQTIKKNLCSRNELLKHAIEPARLSVILPKTNSPHKDKCIVLIHAISRHNKIDIIKQLKNAFDNIRLPYHFPQNVYNDVKDIRKDLSENSFSHNGATYEKSSNRHISIRPSLSLKKLNISIRENASDPWTLLHSMPIPSMNKDLNGKKKFSWGPIRINYDIPASETTHGPSNPQTPPSIVIEPEKTKTPSPPNTTNNSQV